jgi:uncharacterized protein
MPIIPTSTYRSPAYLPGAHLQTIYPSICRRVTIVTKHKERLELADGDFLDLLWSGKSAVRLAILCHGLEGEPRAAYIQGMARALVKRGYDTLAWAYRGCGAETNRLPAFYHSGKTEDLEAIIRHAQETHPATSIDLIGFSLGGNLILKYIGERGTSLSSKIQKAVAFSAPCELACSSAKLSEWQNRIYMERFLRSLRSKVREKHQRFPTQLDLTGLNRIKNFAEFDNRYTAPLHGFADAKDYWKRSSCRQFLTNINIPTLLITAKNDPILGPECYPYAEAKTNDLFHFETPSQGGHLGFAGGKEYWTETRAAEFLSMP